MIARAALAYQADTKSRQQNDIERGPGAESREVGRTAWWVSLGSKCQFSFLISIPKAVIPHYYVHILLVFAVESIKNSYFTSNSTITIDISAVLCSMTILVEFSIPIQ